MLFHVFLFSHLCSRSVGLNIAKCVVIMLLYCCGAVWCAFRVTTRKHTMVGKNVL